MWPNPAGGAGRFLLRRPPGWGAERGLLRRTPFGGAGRGLPLASLRSEAIRFLIRRPFEGVRSVFPPRTSFEVGNRAPCDQISSDGRRGLIPYHLPSSEGRGVVCFDTPLEGGRSVVCFDAPLLGGRSVVCSRATIAAGRIDFCFYAPFRGAERVFRQSPV